ncbi:hypothetical protein K3165_09045 [Qipengyuania sp. 1XM1-15A]|uniref:hypothetical protein n=1 Tax=Qipengyuania xiamenensis TaxID=2867237 RepID=UPI001C880CE4|nr:hypothetical protein [Qipengyuania xiamenensis]MBX7533066.1 hypothetical protein [Qipengyuania xiamenensis]
MSKAIYCVAAGALLAATPLVAGDDDKPTMLRAKDAHQAASMTLSEENKDARICVRQKQLGSRVRFNRICMQQHEWKAYLVSLDAMDDEWNNAAKGKLIK